jgi:hypothetical protein
MRLVIATRGPVFAGRRFAVHVAIARRRREKRYRFS